MQISTKTVDQKCSLNCCGHTFCESLPSILFTLPKSVAICILGSFCSYGKLTIEEHRRLKRRQVIFDYAQPIQER